MEHYYLCPSDYLAHHGVTGMKWGVMHGPPYPLKRTAGGQLDARTQLKRKIQAAKSDYAAHLARKKIARDERRAEKISKKQEKELAKQEKKKTRLAAQESRRLLMEEKVRAADADKREALKQYVRRNPKEFPKYTDVFSETEINDLISKINLDRRVQDIRDEEVKRRMGRVKSLVDNVKTVQNALETTTATYNAAIAIWNTIGDYNAQKNGMNYKPLPRIGGNKDKKDGKENKNS